MAKSSTTKPNLIAFDSKSAGGKNVLIRLRQTMQEWFDNHPNEPFPTLSIFQAQYPEFGKYTNESLSTSYYSIRTSILAAHVKCKYY